MVHSQFADEHAPNAENKQSKHGKDGCKQNKTKKFVTQVGLLWAKNILWKLVHSSILLSHVTDELYFLYF